MLGLKLNHVSKRGYWSQRFKNVHKLVNLGALKSSLLNKLRIFQCMGKVPLKLHTKYLTHTLKKLILYNIEHFIWLQKGGYQMLPDPNAIEINQLACVRFCSIPIGCWRPWFNNSCNLMVIPWSLRRLHLLRNNSISQEICTLFEICCVLMRLGTGGFDQ